MTSLDTSVKESSAPRRRLSCSTCFDALWFCYSPVHQMQQYYRLGVLDNCTAKWSALVDCLTLKTKPSSQVEHVLILEWKFWKLARRQNPTFGLFGHRRKPILTGKIYLDIWMKWNDEFTTSTTSLM